MKNNKITKVTRLSLFICGLGLLVVLFTPMWRIDLQAPQYPEGLRLLIYANKLAGNVDIINGLNHYIGMKTLHANDFAEFKILPGIIVFFSVLFITAAFIAKRKWMNTLCILFVAFGILAMVDFWRWEYDYGHHLNPDAAIIVPGMAYQPPLIGFKQLLNFGAYSVPDMGGWIFVGVGAVLLSLVIFEWLGYRKLKRSPGLKTVIAMISLVLLNSCTAGPEALKIGKDNCSFCKMIVSDNHFGGEVITRKGKVYKFDDAHCLLSFIHSKAVEKKEIDKVYFTDFTGKHTLIKADDAFLLQSDFLKGPMNGNIVAFSNEDSMKKIAQQYKGVIVTWKQLDQ